jgi:hypothetical protein
MVAIFDVAQYRNYVAVLGPSNPQIIIHGDLYLLVRSQIPLGGLDRRVSEQKLDLLEIASALPAEL